METHTHSSLKQFHLRAGWLGLLIFLSLGIALEALHAVKLPFYLDDRNATRRLMWTLAHSHGTLFSLINIAFALSVAEFESVASLRWVSRGLIAALILLPLGFFLGGFGITGGDPGIGVLLAPIGALAMLAAIFNFVRALFARPTKTPPVKNRKGSH
jgi:hypothetical protein